MSFCPTCGNLLLVESAEYGNRFFCQTCPYVHNICEKITSLARLPRKVKDDVLGGAEAWKNVDKTEAECPKCGNKWANYMQIQTRSADEPMTIFYRCTNQDCVFQWKEG